MCPTDGSPPWSLQNGLPGCPGTARPQGETRCPHLPTTNPGKPGSPSPRVPPAENQISENVLRDTLSSETPSEGAGVNCWSSFGKAEETLPPARGQVLGSTGGNSTRPRGRPGFCLCEVAVSSRFRTVQPACPAPCPHPDWPPLCFETPAASEAASRNQPLVTRMAVHLEIFWLVFLRLFPSHILDNRALSPAEGLRSPAPQCRRLTHSFGPRPGEALCSLGRIRVEPLQD